MREFYINLKGIGMKMDGLQNSVVRCYRCINNALDSEEYKVYARTVRPGIVVVGSLYFLVPGYFSESLFGRVVEFTIGGGILYKFLPPLYYLNCELMNWFLEQVYNNRQVVLDLLYNMGLWLWRLVGMLTKYVLSYFEKMAERAAEALVMEQKWENLG